MTTLYKKVGRRYKPVAEHEEWDSYPAGAHVEQIIVWTRGRTVPIKQRPCRCIHPTGPHAMTETCAWRTPKTEGVQ